MERPSESSFSLPTSPTEESREMFVHIQDRVAKDFQELSSSNPHPEPSPESEEEPVFSVRWSGKGKRKNPDRVDGISDRDLVAAAKLLVELANSSLPWRKGKVEEHEPVDDKRYKGGDPNCTKSTPAHDVLGSHQPGPGRNTDKLIVEELSGSQKRVMKKSVKKQLTKGSHVCEICRAVFPTGPALGGHKRLHYKPKPEYGLNTVPANHTAPYRVVITFGGKRLVRSEN